MNTYAIISQLLHNNNDYYYLCKKYDICIYNFLHYTSISIYISKNNKQRTLLFEYCYDYDTKIVYYEKLKSGIIKRRYIGYKTIIHNNNYRCIYNNYNIIENSYNGITKYYYNNIIYKKKHYNYFIFYFSNINYKICIRKNNGNNYNVFYGPQKFNCNKYNNIFIINL